MLLGGGVVGVLLAVVAVVLLVTVVNIGGMGSVGTGVGMVVLFAFSVEVDCLLLGCLLGLWLLGESFSLLFDFWGLLLSFILLAWVC